MNKIYENYQGISNNYLSLYQFVEDYKKYNNAKCEENQNTIIMHTKVEKSNKYIVYKKLYIDKKTAKPIKMEIEDINKKMLVYILYDEIKINSINKEEVLAFKLYMKNENI